jgi:hypothetical protein
MNIALPERKCHSFLEGEIAPDPQRRRALGCGAEAWPAGLEVATVLPPPSDMWEKPLRATTRGFIHTPVAASNFGGSNGSGGSYHAKSLRPGLHRARSPGRRRSCRNGCDRSCRGELRGLWWSLRKRLSPNLRLAPLVIVGSCGARSSPTLPFARRRDSQLANPPSSQASLYNMYLAPAC